MKSLAHATDTPAILGGVPSVRAAVPHYTWPSIGPEEEAAVLRVLRRRELSFHRRTGIIQEFEDAFARMHARPFVMSACSGTAALHAAYFGLNLDPGDEVIVPAYTHLGTVLPMLQVGLQPVLCDVDERTGNIDAALIDARVSPRTRAITVTHQYGHVCAMDAIMEIAARHDLYVVEDCSHAHGAAYRGRLAGTFGDAACFSLQAHKAVAAGEGGVLVTSDARIFERAALLCHFRQRWPSTSAEYESFAETGYGLKTRLHPLAAAIALEQLRKLPDVNARRQSHLQYFSSRVRSIRGLEPLHTAPDVVRGGFFRFVFRYKPQEMSGLGIDTYIEALKAEGVAEVMPGSLAKPLHLTRIMQTLDDRMYRGGWPRRGAHVDAQHLYRQGDFPVAERFSALTLQFPAFTHEERDIIDEYCGALDKIARHAVDLCAHFSG